MNYNCASSLYREPFSRALPLAYFFRFLIVASMVACSLLPAGAARGDSLFSIPDDPFKTRGRTSQSPAAPWRGGEPLPNVPAPNAVAAQGAAASLAELTEIALTNHPRAREAWAAARAQAAAVGVAQADYLPQLNGTVGITHSQALSSSGFSVPTQTRYGPSVGLSYVLFDFGVRANQVDAERYRLLAANLNQNRVLQDVVLGVEQAYYQLLGVDQLASANRQTLKNAETSRDAAKGRRAAGLATAGDVFRAETAVAQASLALRRTEGEVAKSKGRLANAVGIAVETEFVLEPWRTSDPIVDIDESIDSLLARAKQSRPDLISAEAQVRAARASSEAIAATGKPTLEVGVNAARTMFLEDERVAGNSYSLGVNLRIPIFTGFRNTYQIRQAEALVEQTAAQRDTLYRDTEFGVWQAYFDLKTAFAALATAQSLLKSADQSAEVALARYKAGVGTLLELLTAQADQANARVQVIQAELDWYTGFARLNHSLGALPQS